MIDKDKLALLSYSEKRELMIQYAKDHNISNLMSLQKEFGITLGGKPVGTKSLRTKVWEEAIEVITTEGMDKYLKILNEFGDSDDLKVKEKYLIHIERMLEYIQPKAPMGINLNINREFIIGFDNMDDTDYKDITEE